MLILKKKEEPKEDSLREQIAIGGLNQVMNMLREIITAPIEHSEALKRMNARYPRGSFSFSYSIYSFIFIIFTHLFSFSYFLYSFISFFGKENRIFFWEKMNGKFYHQTTFSKKRTFIFSFLLHILIFSGILLKGPPGVGMTFFSTVLNIKAKLFWSKL